MTHEITKTLVTTKNGNFNKYTCSEGCYMTHWTEEEDIKEFFATKEICAPLNVDVIGTYHCITEEEYQKYSALQEEALLNDDRLRMNEMEEDK